MIAIQEGPAPASFQRYIKAPGATWTGYSPKVDARTALCAEQHGLCAFCCARIDASDANLNVKVGVAGDQNRGVRCAHIIPQSVKPELQLRWNNLVAACFGGEGTSEEHCDVAQRDAMLHVSPVVAAGGPAPERVFAYGSDGSIIGLTPAAIEDITTLNLDRPQRLRRARRAAALAVQMLIARPGHRTVAELTRMREAALRSHPAFLNVTLYFLDRQIRKRDG